MSIASLYPLYREIRVSIYGNLKKEQLFAHFLKFGEFKWNDVRVLTGEMGRQFAVIRFRTSEGCRRAMDEYSQFVEGVQVSVVLSKTERLLAAQGVGIAEYGRISESDQELRLLGNFLGFQGSLTVG